MDRIDCVSNRNIRIIAAYLKSRLGPGVRLMAMVKSDAYGHSMTRTAEVLGASGCSLFGVAEAEEGVILRDSGCTGEIFIFL